MSHSTDKPAASRYLPGLAVLAFIIASATQGYKQVVVRDDILGRGLQSGKYMVEAIDEPRRGTIFTSDGEIAAENENSATIGIRFDRVPSSPGFFLALSDASGIPATEFASLASRPKIRSRQWRRRMSPEQVRQLESVKTKWRADGLSIHRSGVRDYPLGTAASSILGGIVEGGSPFGLESSFDKVLAGTPGKTVGMVDRDGSFLPMRLDRSTVKKVDGKAVKLTIDSELQVAAADAIKRAVEENQADSGVAIVYNPHDGALLAMANWPSFDPADPAGGNDGEPISVGMNPNYMLAWEPGSTFKVLTLAKALDMGKVEMSDTIACGGSLRVWADLSIRCDLHRGTRAHGVVDGVAAVSRSCNVSAATWARKIGHAEFVRYFDALGIMEKSKLGLPGERSGSFVRNEYAKGLQLATFGFGQSMTATPVGLVSAFGTLANHGVRMRPRIILEAGGESYPAVTEGAVLKPETCDQLLEAMVSTIQSDRGTGKSLRVAGYELGGKTGTAQKINRKTGTVENGGYVSSFVGFVPARNPRVVILVMVDNPRLKHYGSEVAGPVFSSLTKKVVDRLQIPRSVSRVGSVDTAAKPARVTETLPSQTTARPARQSPSGATVAGLKRKLPKVAISAHSIRMPSKRELGPASSAPVANTSVRQPANQDSGTTGKVRAAPPTPSSKEKERRHKSQAKEGGA